MLNSLVGKQECSSDRKQWDYGLFCKKAEVSGYEANVENPVRNLNISNVLHSSVQQKSTAVCSLRLPKSSLEDIINIPTEPPQTVRQGSKERTYF